MLRMMDSKKLSILSQLLLAVHRHRAAALPRHLLSILSQLLLSNLRDGASHLGGPFNSFPVAAKAPAACTLINLSSANFEVRENSPAPPLDTCSVSRNPFPDSRRKEGIWTERNDVERKR
jgi:hypothetical protein